jgi:hypothetical protein
MGDILGVGCSHGPGVVGPLERGSHYLRQHLEEDETPAHLKDPTNWPKQMQEEWGDDQGISYAKKYQEILQPAYRRARQTIDAFNPDFVLIFGDDQYECLLEDLLLPFNIFAIPEVEGELRGGDTGGGTARILGHQEAANYLARELINSGFEVGCSWKLPHRQMYGHAFTTTIRYLDLDNQGWPYRLVPFAVNCYGDDLRVPSPEYPDPSGIGRRLENVKMPPPPGPVPFRCYDMGKRVAEILQTSPYRSVIIGSSSWSHASLTTKNHYMWPDVESDRARLGELKNGEGYRWRDLTADQLKDAGQHEFRNWICFAGAMDGRGKPDYVAWAEAYTNNSCKAVVIYDAE